jgi:Ca-activated chloride channel family protein
MFIKQTIPLFIAALFAAFILGACNASQKTDIVSENEIKTEERGEPTGKQQVLPEQVESAHRISHQENEVKSAANIAMQPRNRIKAKKEFYAADMAASGTHHRMAAPMVSLQSHIRFPSEPLDRENYAHLDQNGVKLVSSDPVSTFSVDVDTGSYTNIRRMLNEGRLPPQDAVRIEEMINYFSYDYKAPKNLKQPFRVTAEVAPAPWSTEKHLLHIGIKGYEMDRSQLPASNLVFLVDVSGSMHSQNKLPLLKSALKMLSNQLSAKDRISLVVYAGASGVVLEPTAGNQTARITSALNTLQAGGSTNGGAGIRLAYTMAERAFIKNGINRVILATDGDFNVGTTNFESLIDLVEQKRKSGISLTTLGFGSGNYNDHLMEQLADKGNGNYAYIDTINEARKVLVDEVGSTLMTIAKDVKIQVEFNPDVVSEYRLIGYENRMLKREDFNNDQVDAGEIGAGHTVTALYEITLKGKKGRIDPLRYDSSQASKAKASSSELAFLRLRYKQPDADKSQLIEYPLNKNMIKKNLSTATNNFRFSAAVAAFGELLRGGTYAENMNYDAVLKLVRNAKGNDGNGYRGEFLNLVRTAAALDSQPLATTQNKHGDGHGIVIE